MTHNVLVIEDQEDIAELVKLHLKDIDCRVKLAFDGLAGLAEAQAKSYDLIILDLMLPGIDGLDICKRLRAKSNYTPILMLTSKSSELDRVLGLELGADDYLTKPFSVVELTARVKAIFRRVSAIATGATNASARSQTESRHPARDADRPDGEGVRSPAELGQESRPRLFARATARFRLGL